MDNIRRKMWVGIVLIVIVHILTLLLCSPIILKYFGIPKATSTTLLISRFAIWFDLLLLYLYAKKIEKQDMLLWKEKEYQWWVYPVSVVALFVAILIGVFFINIALYMMRFTYDREVIRKMMALMRPNMLLLVLTALTAGVTEELTFRGYILPRLDRLFRNPQLAIIVSSALFGLMHFGFGNAYQIAGPMVIGAIFGIYYWKFRNIKVLMFAHFAWDLISFLINLRK